MGDFTNIFLFLYEHKNVHGSWGCRIYNQLLFLFIGAEDITSRQVDAIVNSANPYLELKYGKIDCVLFIYCIHRSGGYYGFDPGTPPPPALW